MLDHLGLSARKSVLGFANIKGAYQPAHPHSLISTFGIPLLQSIISKLATREIYEHLFSLKTILVYQGVMALTYCVLAK